VFGPKVAHRVAEGKHGSHRCEGLVCVTLDMLLECEGPAKEETQVLPCGIQVKRGCPGVGGIAKVDVRVAVTVFLGELKSLQFVVLEDQAHRLGQLKQNFVSQFELDKVLSSCV
jgi:hypothetical protein